MTEKEIYKKGVALLEEWEDVNYCEHAFKFKDEWLTDKEVVSLLNELFEENEELEEERDYFERKRCEYFTKYNKKHLDCIQLKKENKQLKHMIQEAYETERTQIGKSVLKQLMEQIQ